MAFDGSCRFGPTRPSFSSYPLYSINGEMMKNIASRLFLFLILLLLIGNLVACTDTDSTSTNTPVPTSSSGVPTNQVISTPTGTLQDQALQIARRVSSNPAALSIDYDAGTFPDVTDNATIVLLDDIGPIDTKAGKKEIFELEKAIWTNPMSKHLQQFVVWITQGKSSSGYPNISMRANLGSERAASFQWNSLDPDTAWTLYDEVG